MPIWRSLRVIEHLITGATIALAIATARRFGLRADGVPDLVRWWHARLCRALGVRVEVLGELAPKALLVANHVSWLDIPVTGSQARIDFLSKAEVRDWPLIGWMAEIAGTLFITRGANQAGLLSKLISERVRVGGHVMVFPEGTTTDGSRVKRFHPRLFAAAQHNGTLVQPIALRYGTSSAPDPVVPFVGDDALLPHLARLVRQPRLQALIHFLPSLEASGLSRREIAEHCRHAIGEALHIETGAAPAAQVSSEAAESLASPSTSLVEAA